jgi:hypothetical protein
MHVIDDEGDRSPVHNFTEKVENAHREGESIDVRAGTSDRPEQRNALRFGERRQVIVQHFAECVSKPRERELRLGRGRPAAEDPPAVMQCLFVGGGEQCRLADAGLALQEESARTLRTRLEELADRVEFGVPADDRLRCRCDRHCLDLHIWRL